MGPFALHISPGLGRVSGGRCGGRTGGCLAGGNDLPKERSSGTASGKPPEEGQDSDRRVHNSRERKHAWFRRLERGITTSTTCFNEGRWMSILVSATLLVTWHDQTAMRGKYQIRRLFAKRFGGSSGGTSIGDFWQNPARLDSSRSHISLKRRFLTVSGSYWRERR